MFQVFSGVSYACLQVFHLDVAYVCNDFQMFSDVFASVSDACFKCCIYLLVYVATLLHLDVLKVDRVLHMGCAWEAVGGADDVRGSMGDVRGSTGPLRVHSIVISTR
jgi:hypothetical protein